jgi:hypothetical protein
MTAMNLTPPTYQDPEGRWYRLWRERLENARTPYIMPYKQLEWEEDLRGESELRLTARAGALGGCVLAG